MRARVVTTATAVAVAALLLPLSAPEPADAAWESVNQGPAMQIQHVCRDGAIVDLAAGGSDPSEQPTDMTVVFADADNEQFHEETVQVPPVPDVPGMSDPLNLPFPIRFLGRNYRMSWGTPREPGSQVLVLLFGLRSGASLQTVRDCSVNDRFDPSTVGYVRADRPSRASYAPAPYWSYNSTLGTNTVARTGTGRYVVRFPGLAAAGGNAQVTGFGADPANCKIGASKWSSAGSAMELHVRCFNPAGDPVNARFTASFTTGQGAGNRFAFAFANQESTPGPYQPVSADRFNSRGGPISVTRPAKGSYEVTIPDSTGAEDAGSVKVTAVGNGPTACNVKDWSPNAARTAQKARVLCFGTDGQLADQKFAIAYMNEQNVLGNDRMADGYVWADQPNPDGGNYTPALNYQRDTTLTGSGTVTITRAAEGSYDVVLPLQGGRADDSNGAGWDGGTVQVTAYGSDNRRCQVGYWRDSPNTSDRVVRVYCFTGAGARVDTMFTMQYTAQIQ